MKYRSYSLAVIAFIFAAMPDLSSAQSKIGTAFANGKKIEIFSDFTWKYEETSPKNEECESLTPSLSFCGATTGWHRLNNHDPELTAQFRLDDRTYAIFIAEDIGAADGMSLGLLKDAAIENFAFGANISPSEVTVFDVYSENNHLGDIETVVYGGKIQGLDIVFKNSISLKKNRSYQMATYRVDAVPTEAHDTIHRNFLDKIAVK